MLYSNLSRHKSSDLIDLRVEFHPIFLVAVIHICSVITRLHHNNKIRVEILASNNNYDRRELWRLGIIIHYYRERVVERVLTDS